MKKHIYTGFIALALILTSGHSFAEFTITPGIGIKEAYNDNIHLEETGEDADFITTLSPYVSLEYTQSDKLSLRFDYDIDIIRFASNTDQDKEVLTAEMRANARPFKGISIDVINIFAREVVDVRDASSDSNVRTNMADTNTFKVLTSAVIPMSVSISTVVGYNFTDLRRQLSIDSEKHSVFIILNHRVTSKMAGALKYDYSVYRPDLTTEQQGTIVEYDRHNAAVSIEHRIASNFIVDGALGKSWTKYETRANTLTTFWNVGAEYKVRSESNMSIGIDYSKFLSDSSISGVSVVRRSDLFLLTDNIIKLTVNPFFEVDTFSNTDRKDKTKGINIGTSWLLSEKATILLDGFWADQQFLPEEEKVRKYGLGCRWDYKLNSKITANIGYKYKVRSSNIASEDFTNNIVWMQADISF